MGKVQVRELESCAGKCPNSSALGSSVAVAQRQVPDDEAMADDYIPAEGLSAALISPHRILVTGGTLYDERVLPFTVIRYLDLDRKPRWAKSVLLRRRRGGESSFPISRKHFTLTYAPTVSQMFLVGGLKVGKDGGQSCKTMFSYDPKRLMWDSIGASTGTVKTDPDQVLGRCFAHVACFVPKAPDKNRMSSRSRSKSFGFLFVHGGYASTNDKAPRPDVHFFDIKQKRWCHTTPNGSISSPKRAYHAAAATESGKYVVIHGGACSDYYDELLLSEELFVYDVQLDRWSKPQVHPSSETPPSARKKHTLVNGIGQHSGNLIMYGGYVPSGDFSDEMYSLRLIEPHIPGGSVDVVWEKIYIQFPVSKPLPQTDQKEGTFGSNNSEEKRVENIKVAAACLVPVPKLRKYILLGGRGRHGIRKTPLLIDAEDTEDAGATVTPEKPVSFPTIVQIGTKKEHESNEQIQASLMPLDEKQKKLNDLNKNATNHKCEIIVKRQRTPDLPEQNQLSTPKSMLQISSNQPSLKENSLQANAYQNHQNALSSLAVGNSVLKEREPIIINESTPDLIVEDTPVAKLNHIHIHDKDPRGDHNKTRGNEYTSRDGHGVPQTTVIGLNEAKPAKRTRATKRKLDIDSLASTPPPKKRAGNIVNAADLDNDDRMNSSQSEFMTPTEIAKRNRSQSTRSKRGRGRGRPTTTSRQKAAAKHDELFQEQEKTLRHLEENAKLIHKLQDENLKLKAQNENINTDNKELNKRMSSLLNEVQELRNSEKKGKSFDKEQKHKTTRGILDDSPESVAETPPPKALCESTSNPPDRCHDTENGIMKTPVMRAALKNETNSRSVEVKALRLQIANLQEDYEEANVQKENLNQSVKEMEQEKRAIQKELYNTKNQIEKDSIEINMLRRQANDLNRMSDTANKVAEEAQKQIRRIEELNNVLKIGFEDKDRELKDERRQTDELKLELKGKDHTISILKNKISEVEQKHSTNGSDHRRLIADLGSERTKTLEIQSLLDETVVEKQQLEERNLDLVAEREAIQAELDKRLKECTAALVDNDRSRDALDREKKEVEAVSMEQTRLRAQIDASQRENQRLQAQLRQQEHARISMLSTFTQFKSQFEIHFKQPTDFSPIRHANDTMNSQMPHINPERKRNSCVEQGKPKTSSETTGEPNTANLTKERNTNKPYNQHVGIIPRAHESKKIAMGAAIPDSDESEEP